LKQYEKLEKLLLAENGRIVHAMFEGIAATDADKVSVYIFVFILDLYSYLY
jgi:hypothetical protein